ncbi:deoxyuridine 5'-triphosphate nucleotidohydrolase, partial [Halorubrum distributum]
DCYRLERGSYVVRYGERVRIPEERIGFVLPRSTLLRNACTLDTAVWDAGYEGVGEGRLDVGHPIEIEPGARIAQLVLAEADHEGTYDGAYQRENL